MIIIPTDSYFSEGLKPPTRILIFEMVWVCPKDFQDALSKSPKHSQAGLMHLADPEYGLRPCI